MTPSAWPIILLAIALFLSLYHKNKHKKWEYIVLMFIPAIIVVCYAYIMIFDPSSVIARAISRYMIIALLTLGTFVSVMSER